MCKVKTRLDNRKIAKAVGEKSVGKKKKEVNDMFWVHIWPISKLYNPNEIEFRYAVYDILFSSSRSVCTQTMEVTRKQEFSFRRARKKAILIFLLAIRSQ